LWYDARKVDNTQLHNVGISGTNAMQRLFEKGCCFEDRWSFEDVSTGKFQVPPDINAERDALTKKIVEFKSLDPKDTDQWVHELSDKNPIWIAIKAPDEWKGSYRNRLFERFGSYQATGGYHAIVVVGYHSHYPYDGKGIKAFKIRNSWDTNWGENGYTWVPAETLTYHIMIDRNAPLVIKGWKKGDYGQLRELEKRMSLSKENEEILERIRKYAEEEKKWLGAEYEYLTSLKKSIENAEENEDYEYKEANRIMVSVGRSEYVVDGFEERIQDNLSDLMHNMQGQYISIIRDIEVNLKALAGTLVKLTSRHAGDIRKKLNDVIEDSSKKDEKYQLNKNALKEMIDGAIHTVRGLVVELDKLLNLEEGLHKNPEQG
jgi:hypothetical protein